MQLSSIFSKISIFIPYYSQGLQPPLSPLVPTPVGGRHVLGVAFVVMVMVKVPSTPGDRLLVTQGSTVSTASERV